MNAVCHIPGYGPHGVVRLASGSKDKSIRIWEIPKSTAEAAPESENITTHKTLTGHSGEVKAICFLPTGLPKSEDISQAGYLVSSSTDRYSKVWSLDVVGKQEEGEMLGNVCVARLPPTQDRSLSPVLRGAYQEFATLFAFENMLYHIS